MICPKCGSVDRSIPVPESTKKSKKLGSCRKCGAEVYCIPTQKRGEESAVATVEEGERREDILADTYLGWLGGRLSSRKRGPASDIDRDVLDQSGEVVWYLEVKERSNTINAYQFTQFPFAKIEEAKRLVGETGKPVFIVLKFADCWARTKVEMEKEYRRGSRPFAPRYRPWQRSSERQVPVLIPVEELEVLDIRKECREKFDVED